MVFDDDDTHSRSRSSSDACPTADPDTVNDELLRKVQQTYDVCVRLRSNVSHCGQELMRVVGLTPDGVETVRRGLALSKNMLEATFESVVINCVLIFVHCLRINLCRILTQACSTFEEILITQQNMLKKETVVKALQAAAGPYKELEVFNSELMTLHGQHVGGKRRAGGNRPSKGMIDDAKGKSKGKGKGKATDNSKGSAGESDDVV